MGIFDRFVNLVKAEVNHRLNQTGLNDDEDIRVEDLEEEIRRLEEEMRREEQKTSQRRRRPQSRPRAKTAYDILGVSSSSPQREIKDQYRTLAKKYHPDRVQRLSADHQEMAKQKMKEINQAYDQIEDADKRREYDRKIGLA